MQSRARQFLSTAVLAFLGVMLAYFAFNLLAGSSSIFTLATLKQQQTQSQTAMDATVAERKAKEDKVIRMRPETLDWDMAEQEAIKALGERARVVAPTPNDAADVKTPEPTAKKP